MEIIIAIILIIGVLLFMANKAEKEEMKYFSGCTYIDGSLKIYDSHLSASVQVDRQYVYVGTLKFKVKIPISKVLYYDLKTETEIREQVTLGRLIAFGIFALGMKKQKKDVVKYVVLEYLDENDDKQNMILQSKDASLILNTINQYKNEYNQSQGASC